MRRAGVLWVVLWVCGPLATSAQEREPESTVEPQPGPAEPKTSAETAPAPIVRAIRFEGLLRFDIETSRRTIGSREGAPLDRKQVSRDIEALYRTGAFQDIVVVSRPEADGIALVFRCREHPAVNRVLIEGNEEISEEDLRKKVSVRPAAILDRKRVEESVQALRDHYVGEGYFMAEVDYELREREGNLVDVVFVVREHAKVKVSRIEFVGNEHIPAEELKGVMQTREGSLFGFLTGAGMFSPPVFESDVQNLQYFYNTKGYAEARVDPPVVMLSRDRRFITISITVHEGPQYRVGKVDIEGDLLRPNEEWMQKLQLRTGNIFNLMDAQADARMLSDECKDQGYAFATVSNLPVFHREERILDFTYLVQKGERARFGRIEIVGNEQTRDWTIRRELRFYEGDWYSETTQRESEARIRRLGFFDKVEIKPKPGKDPGQVDVTVEVKERRTGAFSVGAGVSSVENFMFQAQIAKQNFMGRGQTLSLQAIFSSLRTIYQLSFDEPYLFDTNWTFGLEMYNYEYLYYNFTKKTRGIGVTFGRRITDDFGVSATYRIEGVDVGSGGQRDVTDVPIAHLYDKGLLSSLTATAWYDSLDDRMFPTRGNFSSVSLEWAGSEIGSHFEYLRFMARSRQYFPFVLGSVLKIAGTYGHIANPKGGGVPLGERFYVGGIFSVRGFERFSLGPRLSVGSARDPAAYLMPFTIGGTKELYFNTEVEFPIFMPVGIRGVVFFDAGNAFDDHEPVNPMNLRTSVGFGIRWWSPMGPLRFEWGFPLRPKSGEPPMVFEFTIGAF